MNVDNGLKLQKCVHSVRICDVRSSYVNVVVYFFV